MHSEQETTDLRDRVKRLEDIVTGARAVLSMDQPDYLAAIYEATQLLYALLALPEQRPGCWEAAHVTALGEQLGEVLDALRAERPAWLQHDGGAA